jgi:hypothetical protein
VRMRSLVERGESRMPRAARVRIHTERETGHTAASPRPVSQPPRAGLARYSRSTHHGSPSGRVRDL